MVNLPVTLASIETPMERIFEKVMKRKMTAKEKEVLQLNGSAKTRKRRSGNRAGISPKSDSRMHVKCG